MKLPILRFAVLGLLVLLIMSVVSAFAAGISVPASNAGQQSVPVTAEDIKPAACGGIYLSNIVRGSGTLTGTVANDLIVGSAGSDNIDGAGGDDCILGSTGDDTLTGGDGNDVCIGSAGNDTFTDCEVETQ